MEDKVTFYFHLGRWQCQPFDSEKAPPAKKEMPNRFSELTLISINKNFAVFTSIEAPDIELSMDIATFERVLNRENFNQGYLSGQYYIKNTYLEDMNSNSLLDPIKNLVPGHIYQNKNYRDFLYFKHNGRHISLGVTSHYMRKSRNLPSDLNKFLQIDTTTSIQKNSYGKCYVYPGFGIGVENSKTLPRAVRDLGEYCLPTEVLDIAIKIEEIHLIGHYLSFIAYANQSKHPNQRLQTPYDWTLLGKKTFDNFEAEARAIYDSV